MNAKIARLLEQAAEEALPEEALPKLASHPYYGIKDANGWLTRYPTHDNEGEPYQMLPRQFVET